MYKTWYSLQSFVSFVLPHVVHSMIHITQFKLVFGGFLCMYIVRTIQWLRKWLWFWLECRRFYCYWSLPLFSQHHGELWKWKDLEDAMQIFGEHVTLLLFFLSEPTCLHKPKFILISAMKTSFPRSQQRRSKDEITGTGDKHVFQMKRNASASFCLTDIFTRVFPLLQIGKIKNTAYGALSIILKETDPRSGFCLKCKFAVTWKSFEVLQKLWRIHTEKKWAIHVSPISGRNNVNKKATHSAVPNTSWTASSV